ncbi:hypothetical protein SASPL_142619 [Salvia splendens]|uniref:PPM-type phosphatase domain-containing protein n=1 Tax=Salvia splendens TaxID=180675 RepID=A0A8X8WL70_SALSN|nr:hypothetical protein SASPL_142619 [Salvia splendens]
MNDGAVIAGCPSLSGALKRKRPLRIEIPAVLSEIPNFEESYDDPVCCFADSGVGVYSLKGKKKFMEDSYKVFASANGDKFFGVYDGYGGSKAAAFVAENLHLKIFEMLESISENKEKKAACKAGYLKTDEEFLKQGLDSGACCVTVLIDGREMVVSNLGDCRAGGYVEIHRGTWRVHGTLAVSRSIGDAHLKDWVMAEPDTKVVCLDPDMKYILSASDGFWEEVSNEEAVDVVMQSCSSAKKQRIRNPSGRKMDSIRQRGSADEDGSPPAKSRRISVVKKTKMKTRFPENENRFLNERGLLAACKKLADLAVGRGSLDDITVMIIDLNHYNHESLVVAK